MSSSGPVDESARLGALIDDIRREFPRFRIVRKDRSPLSRAIHWGLVAVTFGAMRSYLGGYHTTIRNTVYVTPDWDARPPSERLATLRHERVHLRQFRRYTFLGMSVLYLFFPLPVGLAYFRARFEWEAYRETLRATADLFGPAVARAPALRRHIVEQFTGPSYGWMWPFRRQVERWYDRALAEIAAVN